MSVKAFTFQKDSRNYQLTLEEKKQQVPIFEGTSSPFIPSSPNTAFTSIEFLITVVDLTTLEKWKSVELLDRFTFTGLGLLFEDALIQKNDVSFQFVRNQEKVKIQIKIQDRYKGETIIEFVLSLVVQNDLENLKLVLHKQNIQLQDQAQKIRDLEQIVKQLQDKSVEFGTIVEPIKVQVPKRVDPFDRSQSQDFEEYMVFDLKNNPSVLTNGSAHSYFTVCSFKIKRSGTVCGMFSVAGDLSRLSIRFLHNTSCLPSDQSSRTVSTLTHLEVKSGDWLYIKVVARPLEARGYGSYFQYPQISKPIIRVEYMS
eukprot:TRINITY_DN5199_c0_g1_i1.p1 TRINITY_DN5199_c0_g1~~TRINITY_DN5199_c0_g1_i1.p1  ORF type:complete len:328 (+),score=74.02 TRINITY_DN5199_c0_g1_i1:48-986(+)